MKSSPTNIIRVLIADDHPIVREGLAAILRSEKDIKIVAEAADGEEACNLYDRHSPDVVLLDLRMPKKDGLQVVAYGLWKSGTSKPILRAGLFIQQNSNAYRPTFLQA